MAEDPLFLLWVLKFSFQVTRPGELQILAVHNKTKNVGESTEGTLTRETKGLAHPE